MAQKLPSWFRQKIPPKREMDAMQALLMQADLHTVCQEARCPNQGDCWRQGVATFMILGDHCSRSCRFCAVKNGALLSLDPKEPQSVAEAVKKLRLSYVVITSVTRDDLPDGGAAHFCRTVECIRQIASGTRIELLTPDFQGCEKSLKSIAESGVDVLGFNIETIQRHYPHVRPQGDYRLGLEVLKAYKRLSPRTVIKTGFMVGLGETFDEIRQLLRDVLETGAAILTIGQYLAPSTGPRHVPVEKFWHPDEFAALRQEALAMGFGSVTAGPLVRSSYLAEEGYRALNQISAEIN